MQTLLPPTMMSAPRLPARAGVQAAMGRVSSRLVAFARPDDNSNGGYTYVRDREVTPTPWDTPASYDPRNDTPWNQPADLPRDLPMWVGEQDTALQSAPNADLVVSRDEAGATTAAPASNPLTDAGTQAAIFNFLGTTSAVLGIAAVAAPELLLDLNFGSGAWGTLDPAYVRIAGATMAASAAAEFALKSAAENTRLQSATYQRLLLACALKSAGYIAAFAAADELWNPMLATSYVPLAAISLFTSAGILLLGDKATQGKPPKAMALPLMPSSALGVIYSVIAISYLATCGACYLPGGQLFHGAYLELAPSQLLRHTWAPGFALAAVAAINLRDAADRDRLGASTFKTLNLGLALMELTYAATYGEAMSEGLAPVDGQALSNLAISVGIFILCISQYASAGSRK